METQRDLAALRSLAERAGLDLTDQDLLDLSVGVQRNDAYARAMRSDLEVAVEPALTFSAPLVREPRAANDE